MILLIVTGYRIIAINPTNLDLSACFAFVHSSIKLNNDGDSIQNSRLNFQAFSVANGATLSRIFSKDRQLLPIFFKFLTGRFRYV